MLSLLLMAGLTVLLAASCLALASSAEARPHSHVHRHKHAWHAVRSVEASSLFTALAGDSDRVCLARRYLGEIAAQIGLPRSLWCADFVNLIERRLGRSGTGSRAALSFEGYGHRLPGPQVGAIATMSRRGGGHVGFVTTYDVSTVTVISGNHNGVVAEGVYDRRRIRGYWS